MIACVDTLCARDIESQVSFACTSYGSEQIGELVGIEGAVEVEFSAYGSGDVKAYSEAVQLFVVELKSLASSSSYPKGELSWACIIPSMQSEQF